MIHTFWLALLGWVVGMATFVILIGWFSVVATGLWYIHRIVVGWVSLYDGDGWPMQ